MAFIQGGELQAPRPVLPRRQTKSGRVTASLLEVVSLVCSRNVAMAGATLFAVFALLTQVGSLDTLWNTVRDAESGWLLGALALSLVTNVGFAISLMGTVPIRLPLWPTTKVQVAMSFSNLAVPAIGGTAMQVRFLRKQGICLAGAVASGGLLAPVANVVAQCLLLPVALLLSPTGVDLGTIPTDGLADAALVIAALVVLVAGVVLRVPRLRLVVVPAVLSALLTIGLALRSPRRIALLLVGNLVVSILYAACLLLCIKAYGGDVSFWSLLAVNIGIGTIAPLVPVPGGGTAVSVVGLTGALGAFGVPHGVAIAAILTNQLVVTYLPAVAGWFATRDLLKQGLV